MGMSVPAEINSLFEIDRELDLLLDEIQEEVEDGRGDSDRSTRAVPGFL
jgi:hypothetical protein